MDTCDLDLIYMVCGEVLVTPAWNLQNKGIIYTFVYDDFYILQNNEMYLWPLFAQELIVSKYNTTLQILFCCLEQV